MEPRACVARFDAATGDLTLWVTSQNPHVHRLLMTAFVLGIPEHKVRVIAPDVGGGFGSKIFLYNEETVCSWATRQIKRPIRWTSTRREAFQTDAHGRDHVTDVELALARDGKILGLRVKTVANMGAYLSTFAPAVPTYLYGTLLNGVYEIGAIHADVTGVFTNTTPVDAYRGAGRPEAAYLLERMVEAGAAALKMDVADLRKKNFIPKFADGFQTKVALNYDSGNYGAAFDKLLTMLDYRKVRSEQEAARKQGKLIGVGFSTYIEACSIAPSKVVGSLGAQAGLYESGIVRVHPTGKVTVFTGSHSHGQGHETTFSQLVADELGLAIEDVEIVHGDTGAIAFGMGTYGSRSASVGGTAIHMSISKIKEKGKKIAAHLLEASPGDMEYVNGQFQVKGFPGKAVPFGQVALTAYVPHKYPEGLEPGLEETSFYDPSNFCFPFGAHACVVEVDRDTGHVKVLPAARRYHQCGAPPAPAGGGPHGEAAPPPGAGGEAHPAPKARRCRRPEAIEETPMSPAAFESHPPASVAEALKLLGKLDDAKILAGGHSLIPMMKLRLAQPKHLIDLRKVSGLTGIKESGGTIWLGAMSTHWEVESSKVLKGKCAIVSETAAMIAHLPFSTFEDSTSQ